MGNLNRFNELYCLGSLKVLTPMLKLVTDGVLFLSCHLALFTDTCWRGTAHLNVVCARLNAQLNSTTALSNVECNPCTSLYCHKLTRLVRPSHSTLHCWFYQSNWFSSPNTIKLSSIVFYVEYDQLVCTSIVFILHLTFLFTMFTLLPNYYIFLQHSMLLQFVVFYIGLFLD